MNKGVVIVISGPSGCGKGCVMERLMEICPTIGLSVSATSRAPRPGEQEGVNYFYKTKEEFEALIENGEVLEYTVYNGNYYGTLKSEVRRILGEGKDVVLEIEVDGGGQVKRLLGDDCVTVMLTAPSVAEQEKRLRGRGTETDEVIRNRLERTREEIAAADDYDYVVVNYVIDDCADLIRAIIRSERSRVCRMRDFLAGYFDGEPEEETPEEIQEDNRE